MKIKSTTAALLLTATVCLADANVQQKNQVHFGGLLGGVMNVFARDAGEGITSSSIVKGDRKLTRTGNAGQIIDLAEEKVYRLDFDRKTYSVKTFADLRREYQDQQERARKSSERQTRSAKDQGAGPEYEVDFDIKATGKKETINGWNTHQEIVTVSVHEKGKKIDESGGFVLTSDMWMGPKIAAYRELADFDRRFIEKVYGSDFSAAAGQMAAAMAMSPAFGKAMKAFNEKQSDFEGTPIRTKMTFETVAGANQDQKKQQTESDSSTPSSAPDAVIGSLFNKMKQQRKQQEAESGQSPNRSTLFDSNSELIQATTTASASDVAVPSDFRQR
jgi:hypothetical protein